MNIVDIEQDETRYAKEMQDTGLNFKEIINTADEPDPTRNTNQN